MSAPSPAVITVCVSCQAQDGSQDRPGVAFHAGLADAAAGTGIVVRKVQCMSVCKRPCTVAMSGEGSYTYVFGDLEPVTGIPALIACAAAFAATEHGYLLWRERPEALRRSTLLRVPPPGWLGEDGRHPR